ncbi:tellurite resistance TerB C-terminal domain-containing protein [Chryseobacterium luteum]|uniref:TerB-C domain-containing protein n=1 Tax=Chryseobacterium luteum TaxID=421531 RepID=A0A085ZCU4_9FLAO|nr:tellurite resistance TerB C-terminal domain-containing protein [Chryseobacterium luteum]KFF02258.1 hypothetical protein IX38_13600 [Chryseobacterium luteum]
MERPILPQHSNNDFITDVSGMEEIPIQYQHNFTSSENEIQGKDLSSKSYHYEVDTYKIGTKYRRKLTLNDNQCILLDRLSFNNNVFNEIEYCKVQILKQFLRVTDFLLKECIPVNRSYQTVVDELSEIIIVLEYNYKHDSLNYKYTFESIQSEIFNHLLKLCENNVRDFYEIKRKINTDFKYTKPEILEKLNKKIISKAEAFLEQHKYQILDADYRTNLILNETNTSRWKSKFELIKSDYRNAISFEREVARLAEVNVKNPSVDSLYFEASKFISGHDKNSALRLYIHYLDKDLNSQKFDNRKLTKTIQKSLFTTTDQFSEFESIVNEFVQNRDLNSCLEKVKTIYLPKRKKIIIDSEAIEQVKRLDAEIAHKLGEILSEEDEENSPANKTNREDDSINIAFSIVNVPDDEIIKYVSNLGFNDIQKGVLDLFEKNSFTILHSEFSDYMKARQLFVGAAIESINEVCFELLDDILIEEEDEYLTINHEYFKKLLTHD